MSLDDLLDGARAVERGEAMKCQIGDWVRFYCNGELKIGVVEYVRADHPGGYRELATTAGSVREESVLERRGSHDRPRAVIAAALDQARREALLAYLDVRRFERAPWGYYQPSTHPCSAYYHQARYYIVDDICDGGRTFVELAKVMREHRAHHIELFVTHGFFTKGKQVFDGLIDKVHAKNDYSLGRDA